MNKGRVKVIREKKKDALQRQKVVQKRSKFVLPTLRMRGRKPCLNGTEDQCRTGEKQSCIKKSKVALARNKVFDWRELKLHQSETNRVQRIQFLT